MTGKTHVAVGVTSLLALTVAYPEGLVIVNQNIIIPLGFVSVAAGSYAPDIDLHTTSLGRKHKIISSMLTHRGITHTLLFPLVMLVILNTIGTYSNILASILFGFLFGWVFHIIADYFNKKGVPVLWPIYSKKIHFPLFYFKTGTWQESVFLGMWVSLCVIFVYYIRGGSLI